MKKWLNNSTSDLELKKEAINCKAGLLSNMIVYYSNYCLPAVKMISIDKYELKESQRKFETITKTTFQKSAKVNIDFISLKSPLE